MAVTRSVQFMQSILHYVFSMRTGLTIRKHMRAYYLCIRNYVHPRYVSRYMLVTIRNVGSIESSWNLEACYDRDWIFSRKTSAIDIASHTTYQSLIHSFSTFNKVNKVGRYTYI